MTNRNYFGLSDAVLERLRELAKATRLPASEIVRELVNDETIDAWAKRSTRWVGKSAESSE